MHLLVAVAESEEGLTAKSLADRFGLSLPTTYHLLTTLWAEGMLIKDQHRVFKLGPRAAIVAEGYQRLQTVPSSYRRALDYVVAETGETAYLSAWRGMSVKVLETREGQHAVRVVGLASAGYSSHLHARASGKLLLAFASSEHREQVLESIDFVQLTPNTVKNAETLREELDVIRRERLAFDRQEFQLGVDCVSAPIMSGDRVDACITVSSPSPRFAETRGDIVGALQKAVSDVTAD